MDATSRVYAMSFASVYPLYVAKAIKKGRTKHEVDQIIQWLTGYNQIDIEKHIAAKTNLQAFYTGAHLNPDRKLITGIVCGVRVEDIADPIMQEVRYMDKLIDELARGKSMASILRHR